MSSMVPGRLPAPCIELSFLSLRINFNDVEGSLALCLLRSSPNLRELEILAWPEEQIAVRVSANVVEEDYESCPFNQLRFVKIASISGLRQELNFVKFLLVNSPVLEKISVKPSSIDGEWQRELMKELLCLRRASVQAQIIYLDP